MGFKYFNVTYREILKNLVLRNLRIRYKGTALGFFWAFLNPLLTMLVFYIVFSKIIKIGVEQFPLFLLSALLPWAFFSSSLNDASQAIISNASLVKKTYFPREILPLSYVLSNFINLLLGLCILLPILLIFRSGTLHFIYFLPVALVIHLLFTAGLALFLSCANVFFRDVNHILNIVLMLWFYLTPVFYPVEMIPAQFRNIYLLNPMASIITIYRNVLFDGAPLQFANIIVAVVAALAVFILGSYIFKKYEFSLPKLI